MLQRSPIRFRGNRGDLPTCTEDPASGEKEQRAKEGERGVYQSVLILCFLVFLLPWQTTHTLPSACMSFIHPASDTGKETADVKKEAVQKEQLKAEKGGGTVAETKHPPPGEQEVPGSGCPSSTAPARQGAPAPRLCSPAASLIKAPSAPERPPALTQTLEKPSLTSTFQKKSPSTAPALAPTLEKLLVSPPPRDKTSSTIPAASEVPENPHVSPVSHKKKSPGTVDLGNSTQESGEALSEQHTVKAEPADQRTEPPPSE